MIIKEAEAVFRESIARQPFCLSAPEAIVGVDSHGDFGQNILAGIWVQSDFVVSGKNVTGDQKRLRSRENYCSVSSLRCRTPIIDLALHGALAITPLFKGS